MVDLPLCLQQLSRTREEDEPRRSRCHPSGTIPSFSAKLTRSKATLRSSKSARLLDTATTRPLYGPKYGASCLRVGLQRPHYHGPEFQPLRGDVEVHDRT